MDKIVYRASSLGSCTKRLIAERLGYQQTSTPATFEKYFQAGRDAEDSAIERLRKRGDRVWAEQELFTLHISDRVVVEGHVDGIICGSMFDDSVLEIKSMSGLEFDKWQKTRWDTPGLIQRYKWQISAYMLMTKLPCWVYIVNREGNDAIEGLMTEPFYTMDDIRARVFKIEAQARTGQLPKECDNPIYPCPVYYLHEEPEAEDDDDGAVEALAGTFVQARSEHERAKATLAEVRGRLSRVLGDRGRVDSSSLRVSRYDSHRTSYDYKRMIEDGISLEPYKKVSTVSNLRVTVKDSAAQGDSEPREDSSNGSVERGEE